MGNENPKCTHSNVAVPEENESFQCQSETLGYVYHGESLSNLLAQTLACQFYKSVIASRFNSGEDGGWSITVTCVAPEAAGCGSPSSWARICESSSNEREVGVGGGGAPTVHEKWWKCFPASNKCAVIRAVMLLQWPTWTERLRSASPAPRGPRDRPPKVEFARSESTFLDWNSRPRFLNTWTPGLLKRVLSLFYLSFLKFNSLMLRWGY